MLVGLIIITQIKLKFKNFENFKIGLQIFKDYTGLGLLGSNVKAQSKCILVQNGAFR